MATRRNRTCRSNWVHAWQKRRCSRTSKRRRTGKSPSWSCEIKRLASLHEMSGPTLLWRSRSRGPAALREPVLLQALAKRHPGPIENHPKVGRSDAEFLTNLCSVKLHDFAHHEDAGSIRRKLLQAKIHDFEKLQPRELCLRIAPGRGRIVPMARFVEHGIEVVEPAFLIERGCDRFAPLLADGINDLVLEDAREPGLDARPPGKSVGPLQSRHQRILHHVLGEIRIAKLQDRHTQQISAMGMDQGGEFCGGGVGHGLALRIASGDDSANATADHQARPVEGIRVSRRSGTHARISAPMTRSDAKYVAPTSTFLPVLCINYLDGEAISARPTRLHTQSRAITPGMKGASYNRRPTLSGSTAGYRPRSNRERHLISHRRKDIARTRAKAHRRRRRYGGLWRQYKDCDQSPERSARHRDRLRPSLQAALLHGQGHSCRSGRRRVLGPIRQGAAARRPDFRADRAARGLPQPVAGRIAQPQPL